MVQTVDPSLETGNVNTNQQRSFTTTDDDEVARRVKITDAVETTTEILFRKERASSSILTFIGENQTQNESDTTSTWRVSRVYTSGSDTVTEYATTGGEVLFDKTFDDPASLFDPVPFANQYSIEGNGSNKYVEWPDDSTYDFDANTDAFSIIFSMKSETSNNTYVEKNDSNRGYRIYSTTNRLVAEFRGSGTGSRIRVRSDSTRSELSDGSWHQYAITFDGSGDASGVTMYIDGSSIGLDVQNDTLSDTTENAGDLAVMSRTGGGDYHRGLIDEVCIWSVELDSTNVTAFYNTDGTAIDPLSDTGGYDESASCVFHGHFDADDRTNIPTIANRASGPDGTSVNLVQGNFITEVAP